MGRGGAYLIDLASVTAAGVAVALMRLQPPQGGGTPVIWAGFREGIGFLRRTPILQGTMLIDINAMVFGTPPALFPAIGTEVLGGGAGVVGLLYSAPAAGAFIGALSSGWVGRVRRQGWAVVIAVSGWGAAICAVAFVESLTGVVVLFAVAGFADIISKVFRATISQVVVPNSLRGRLSALFIIQVTKAPGLGDVESGVLGSLIGTQLACSRADSRALQALPPSSCGVRASPGGVWMRSGDRRKASSVDPVSETATGPLDPERVLRWMRDHPDRLRELLVEEDPDDLDISPASDAAIRAHLRLAAEGMVHGAAPDLAILLEGMADELDDWFEEEQDLFDHQIALGEGAIALEEHLLYQGDAESDPALHQALERRVRMATWNLLFLRCIESRLGPVHDGLAGAALEWTATRGRDLMTMILTMDQSQRAALEQRTGRKPTRNEQVQSGQVAAVAAYVRMVIEATAHALEHDPAAT